MCKEISGHQVLPGWGCCRCSIYNGAQRSTCKQCGKPPCKPIDRKALAAKGEALVGYRLYDPKDLEDGQSN